MWKTKLHREKIHDLNIKSNEIMIEIKSDLARRDWKKILLKNISKKLKDYKLYSGGVSIKEIKNKAKFGQGTIGQIF